ncbi:hypothetical protein OROHE_022672 [Orobanche hederae]
MAHNDVQARSKKQSSDVAVVMVPLPAQGHLNQLLHLSSRIAAHSIPVYYAGDATHLRQAKLRLHGWNDPSPPTTTLIHFQEFPTTPFETPPPNPHAPTKFPSQIMPSLKASLDLRSPVFHFVEQLAGVFRRVVVVYDSLMCHVVQDIHAVPDAECYIFRSISAFAIASWEVEISPDLPIASEIRNEIPPIDGHYPPEFADFLGLQIRARKIYSGEIYNSCREIEGFCLDLLEKRMRNEGKKIWAMGPFNPVSVNNNNNNSVRHKCLDWLDRHGSSTVVFVSFGTTCSISDEQIKEISFGLERSEHKFMWVLRDADKGDIFAGGDRKPGELPDGFEERVRERGMIVRDWAPQLEILGHPSIGGFVSHCGWNSCLESISMGVPMATWPQHSDQPTNAILVTKVLKIGVEMKKWSRDDKLVSSGIVEKAVRILMGSSEGVEIRKRASELGKAVKNSTREGGASRKEMDSFINHITRDD